jgi:hypothetical protein
MPEPTSQSRRCSFCLEPHEGVGRLAVASGDPHQPGICARCAYEALGRLLFSSEGIEEEPAAENPENPPTPPKGEAPGP